MAQIYDRFQIENSHCLSQHIVDTALTRFSEALNRTVVIQEFGGGTVFRDIEADVFLLRRDPEAEKAIDRTEDQIGRPKGPDATDQGAQDLRLELRAKPQTGS